ncbi:hypothetical protein HZH68_017135 [Vespula germanica]|uniref:Uncharacterized protein n=1 Tax=Vespula germanica TaxID=30212 RepID=A0A834MN79_VESGE|nr:hypothetical protein HZH68_017135 [Vespula germanica]
MFPHFTKSSNEVYVQYLRIQEENVGQTLTTITLTEQDVTSRALSVFDATLDEKLVVNVTKYNKQVSRLVSWTSVLDDMEILVSWYPRRPRDFNVLVFWMT